MDCSGCNTRLYTVKALLSPRGAYLILGFKRGGRIRERSLIERGGGGLFQFIYFRQNSQ